MKTTALLLLLLLLQTASANLFKANNNNRNHIIYPPFLTGNQVFVANINNDGIDDLVISSFEEQGLVIYLGKDVGGLQEMLTTPKVGKVYEAEVLDVDGDNDSDIWLTVSDTAGNIELLLINDGNGQFLKKTISSNENGDFLYPEDLISGDIDKDGDVDLVKIIEDELSGFNPLGSVARFYINDGTGNFEINETQFNAGRFNELIDFNQDGFLDLISVNRDLNVYYNDQAGFFQQTPQEIALNLPFCDFENNSSDQDDVLFEDIDNDGDIDIQVLSKSMGLPRRINNGDGTFLASADESCVPIEDPSNGQLRIDQRPTPFGILVDANNNGLKDLWVNYDNEERPVINLTGNDGFMTSDKIEIGQSNQFYFVSGNFNLDDSPDVVSLGFNGINQWLYSSPLEFNQADLKKINQHWGFLIDPTAVDFDNDGLIDLVFTQNNKTYYRKGNGAGAFGDFIELTPFRLHELTAMDFNQDGVMDLLGVRIKGGQRYFTVVKRDEFNGFEIYETLLPLNYIGVNFDVSDFDEDGDFDFLINLNNNIHIFQNQGNDDFELIQQTTNKSYTTARFEDMNNQGRAAFIAYNQYDFTEQTVSGFHEYIWNGEVFELGRTIASDRTQFNIVTLDYDGDGDLDILSSTRVDEDHSLLVINDMETFSLSQYSYPGNAILFAADLNNDALTDYIDSNSSVYLNQGSDEFLYVMDTEEMGSIDGLVDLDADGDLDIVATDSGLETHLNQNNNIEYSGLWFNPEESGHGLQLEQIDLNGSPAVNFSWFAFHNGKPFWLVGLAPIEGNTASIPLMFTSGGDFGAEFNSGSVVRQPWGQVDLILDGNDISMSWQTAESGFSGGSMSMQRLAITKATSPVTGVINSCHSGSWFNPTQSGHGFFINVIENQGEEQMTLAWYHYLAGEQQWLVAQGPVLGTIASMSAQSATGSDFPPNFVSSDVEYSDWGQINFALISNTQAKISWSGTTEDFPAGELLVEKLTQLDRYHCI